MKHALRYRIAPGIVSTEVHGEVTVLHPVTGLYFGLDDVGARIWTLLGQESSLGALTKTLCSEFEVTEDLCTTQVQELLSDLVARGLVETVHG